ncbi:MAG: MBL fold metallo-hydrolase [Christensenellales bacterium]|jgi:glyoxylase-like metal-dependent hydrolase (beta-lactamase superfamily II)
MRIITLPVGGLETNCYIAYQEERDDAVIIDPGADAEKIKHALNGRKVAAVLLTHGHFDHTGALYAFADAPIYIHEQDAPMLTDSHFSFGLFSGDTKKRPPATGFLTDGQVLDLAGIQFDVMSTPGHTRGSVCFKVGEDIFTGDTMFKGDYGRTDLPGGSMEAMRASLRRLFALVGCRIYPGHGPGDVIK